VVFLQPKGPKVCDGATHKPGNSIWLLEGYRQGPCGGVSWDAGGDEENPCILQWESPQGKQDGMGDA